MDLIKGMWLIHDETLEAIWVDEESYCYCGSWKKLIICCKLRIQEGRISQDEYNNIHEWSKVWKAIEHRFDKNTEHLVDKSCLCCDETAIWSHTISRSRMKRFFSNWYCAYHIHGDSKQIFKKHTLRKISWFRWWCKKHDNTLFKDIDDNFDILNPKHLTLQSLRGLWKDIREIEEMLKWTYSKLYFYEIDRQFRLKYFGTYNAKRHSEMLTLHIGRYKHYLERKHLYNLLADSVYNNKLNNWITSYVYKIGKISPFFATWSIPTQFDNLISLGDFTKKNYPIVLSIITTNTNIGYAIVTYEKSNISAMWFCRRLKMFFISKREKIKELNYIISIYCSNIASDPHLIWQEMEISKHDYHSYYYNYIELLQ